MDDLKVIDYNVVELPTHATAEANGAQTADMDAVLKAFQLLQMRNSHVSSLVASSLGIGVSDLRALLFISSSEEATPKQVGSFLELTSGAVTNLVDRMGDAGLVQRVPHPNDRRSVVLVLAPDGVESVSRISDFYRRAFGGAVAADQLADLAQTLNNLGESLTRTANGEVTRLLAGREGEGAEARSDADDDADADPDADAAIEAEAV